MRELALRAIGIDAPWAAFTANDGVARILLAVRVVLMMLAWIALLRRDDRAQQIAFAIACGLFVGSLAVNAVFLPFAIAALVVCVRAMVIAQRTTQTCAAIAAFAGVAAVLVASIATTRPIVEPPNDPAGLTVYWLGRSNLFEARLWAERWTGADREHPGEAQLTLARIDWELGHRDIARALLADVATRSTSDDARTRATHQLEAWGR